MWGGDGKRKAGNAAALSDAEEIESRGMGSGNEVRGGPSDR